MSDQYQIVIVGAGPAGLAAAIQAAKRGVSHLLLERAELANTIYRYGKGKHVMAEPSQVPLHENLAMEFEAAAREEVLERWQTNLEAAGVNMERSPGCELVKVEGERGSFQLSLKDGRTLTTESIILAIGTAGNPRRFGVPGDDLPHVGYHLADASEYCDQPVMVVGVGDAGLEDALALARHDNDVYLVNTFEGYPLAKAANRAAIEAAIAAGDIKEFSFTTVERFEEGGVWLNTRDEPFFEFPAPPPTPGGDCFLDVNLVIGRIGALPPRRFLESMGIEFESEHREAMPRINDYCESTKPGIFLVGALAGRPLIKHAMNQGYEVVEHILGNPVSCAELPLLRESLACLDGSVEEIVERVRKTIQVFGCLSKVQVEELLVESQIHKIKRGKDVFLRGDFSNTFYTILDGAIDVNAVAPILSNDADDLDHDVEVAERQVRVETGDFFGEESLLSGSRRSTDARAAEDSILVETSRSAMYRLLKSVPELADEIDRTAALRKLSELLPELPRAEIHSLAHSAEVKIFQAGQVLFEEGDEPDGLHVIRRGSVAVTRERDGKRTVINHVRAGEYLGEIALVRPSMLRSATVVAKVLTETIVVPTKVLLDLTQRYPGLWVAFERRSQERLVRDERVLANPGSAAMVNFLIDQGGKEATDLLVIDEALCIRCDNCEVACRETHGGVSRLDREAGPRYAGVHLPTACQHCENPFCMTDCPPSALKRHPNGEVYILDTCIGCGNCAGYCPYGVIKMKPISGSKNRSLLLSMLFGWRDTTLPIADEGAHELAVKCDLCREVPGVQRGARSVACVSACPTGAIVRIHPMDFVEDILDKSRGDGRCPSCGRGH